MIGISFHPQYKYLLQQAILKDNVINKYSFEFRSVKERRFCTLQTVTFQELYLILTDKLSCDVLEENVHFKHLAAALIKFYFNSENHMHKIFCLKKQLFYNVPKSCLYSTSVRLSPMATTQLPVREASWDCNPSGLVGHVCFKLAWRMEDQTIPKQAVHYKSIQL